jgi:oxygen-dependent protoporphyrinogen oxidase
MSVNLFFPNPDLLPVHGFGYLIPRSVPLNQNPERALGVVFDSDATVGQDTIEGTKVTVMLGGHWWDVFDTYPDEEEGAAMARSVLRRHLGITDVPSRTLVSLQRDCIPQYTVGHDQRMQVAHRALRDGYQGRLQVAGNSYTGVGLNDCVAAGVNAAMTVADDVLRGDDGAWSPSSTRVWTGLEDFDSFPEMKWWTPGTGEGGEQTFVPFQDMQRS